MIALDLVHQEGKLSPSNISTLHEKKTIQSFSLCFLFLRLQKMCATSHTACRQPAVHRGVARAHSKGTTMLLLTHTASLWYKLMKSLLLEAIKPPVVKRSKNLTFVVTATRKHKKKKKQSQRGRYL